MKNKPNTTLRDRQKGTSKIKVWWFVCCIAIYCCSLSLTASHPAHHFFSPKKVIATVTGGNISNYDHAQTDYNLNPGDTLALPAAGLTGSIALGGLTGTPSAHIIIINQGKINLTNTPFGAIFLKNCQYVDFVFTDPVDKYGLRIGNCGFRGVNTDSVYSNNYMHGIDIDTCADFAFFTTHTRSWTGNIADANHDNIFDSIRVNQSQGGWWFGNPSDGIGFWVNTEIRYPIWTNINASDIYSANDCFNISAHDGVYMNTGLGDSTDSGIMDIHGSCKFYNNYVYNYSGSIVRWHGISLVASKTQSEDTSLVYNVVAKVARKYGGVQINSLASDTTPSYIRPGSLIVSFCSFSKFRDGSYWTGPPVGGGGVPCDFYHCWGKTCRFIYCAYDSMHYDHGQNVAVSYLFHNGAGDTPIPDTTGNIRVSNPIVTYADTLHNNPFRFCELTNQAIGQAFASPSINGVIRAQNSKVFVGAYNYTDPTLWIFPRKIIFKS